MPPLTPRSDLLLPSVGIRPPQDLSADAIGHLLLKENGRMHCVRITDVDWGEASGNYVRLHVGSRSIDVRQTMTELCERLSSHRFVRISRTKMVNLDRILEVQPGATGDYTVLLQGGGTHRLTRGYRAAFMERFFVL